MFFAVQVLMSTSLMSAWDYSYIVNFFDGNAIPAAG